MTQTVPIHTGLPRQVLTRQGFTLVELLVVIAIISVISSLVVPSLIEARRRAEITNCANNLKQIYGFALTYSDKTGEGCFPFGRTKAPLAHDSLNELVALDASDLPPAVFVCPSSDATPAVPDSEGRYVLAPENLGYAWVATRMKNTKGNRPLACCKHVDDHVDDAGEHSGHKGGVNVLWTDGSVKFVTADKLDPETQLLAGLTR